MNIEILLDCIKNPAKSQIIFSLKQHKNLTAKELLAFNHSISQATLYRTLKKLEEDEIIQVVSQTQKRGTFEKKYILSKKFLNSQDALLSTNDGTVYANYFADFVGKLLVEFNEYAQQDNIDIKSDGSGFSAVPIYATPEELEKYSLEIKKILEPSFKRKSEDQKIHTLATIITPPREENSDR